MSAGKLGKQPADPTKPKLKLATLLPDTAAIGVPEVVDFISAVPSWPMYLNDEYGICVPAGIGHVHQAATAYGQGVMDEWGDGTIATLYHDVTGWDPTDPDTDQGTVVQDALSFWRKTGINGNKIVAFASVDIHNDDEMAAALYYFGHLLVGFDVYQSAINQFNHGDPWDFTQRRGDYLGGHCVNIGYDDATSMRKRCITWGKVQEVTDEFLDAWCDEAWVIVTQDWVNTVTGRTPAGMDLEAFGAAFTQLTGQPNPFPAPEPAPTPEPDPVDPPTPAPVVVTDAADVALAPFLHKVAKHPFHHVTKHDHEAIVAWLTDKNL